MHDEFPYQKITLVLDEYTNFNIRLGHSCGTLNCTDQCLHRLTPSLKNEVNFNNLIDLGEVQMTNT